MKILCLTDFPVVAPDRWIWNHLPHEQDEVTFIWAEPSDKFSGVKKALTRYPAFWSLALRAMKLCSSQDYDLVVAWESKTGIPLAVLRRLKNTKQPPCVILTFTPGETPPLLRPVIRQALKTVQRVTVITQAEREVYHRLFGLPHSKATLCLLGAYDLFPDGPPGPVQQASGAYIHASGRSARDYATLLKASDGLSVKVIIHGRGWNFSGLSIPSNVSVGSFVPRQAYHDLVCNAAIEVVPLIDTPAPVGSSQIVFAMMLGKAIVATRTGSTVDYIENMVTGLLVEPGDPAAMRAAIEYLLNNPAEAQRMGQAARRRFEERHTFEAFAQQTRSILQQVYASDTPPVL